MEIFYPTFPAVDIYLKIKWKRSSEKNPTSYLLLLEVFSMFSAKN